MKIGLSFVETVPFIKKSIAALTLQEILDDGPI
jgi:hypothetical protein